MSNCIPKGQIRCGLSGFRDDSRLDWAGAARDCCLRGVWMESAVYRRALASRGSPGQHLDARTVAA